MNDIYIYNYSSINNNIITQNIADLNTQNDTKMKETNNTTTNIDNNNYDEIKIIHK